LSPGDHLTTLELDLGLAFPMIEVLLGGPGATDDRVRELTEIEEQILEVMARIVGKELEGVWNALGLTFNFEGRQQAVQLQRLMPPSEKIMALSFELQMGESRGSMNLAFSGVVSNALQRKLSKDWGYQRPAREKDEDGKLKRKLLRCRFPATLACPEIPV